MTWFPGLRPHRRRRRILAGAAVLALAAVGTAAAITTRATVAPTNSSLPTTGGVNTVGSTLTANAGTWNGSTPITFQYQWEVCDGNGAACHAIAGSTSQTYTLKADDAGNTVRVQVIASNADGSASARSVPSARIAPAAAGPANTVPPSITGTTNPGSTLTANNGTWTGPTPITFTYQWTVCDNNGAACHDISGATSNTYVLKNDDAGNTIRVRVTAKNSAGSTSATSAATAVVAGGGGGGGGGTQPGCPTPPAGTTTVDVKNVQPPARLQVAQYRITTGTLTLQTRTFSIRFVVTDTCNHPVSGALVYPTAVPYNQFSIPAEKATDATGAVVMTFNRLAEYPASAKQQQLTMFVRARRTGEPVLAGISTRRLIAFSIQR
jgi:hypothetical protein